jgi:hypothetical protein
VAISTFERLFFLGIPACAGGLVRRRISMSAIRNEVEV